jgi:hypothetical protein
MIILSRLENQDRQDVSASGVGQDGRGDGDEYFADIYSNDARSFFYCSSGRQRRHSAAESWSARSACGAYTEDDLVLPLSGHAVATRI